MTKADWRRIIIAFMVLAVAWTAAGFIIARNYADIRDNQDRLEGLSISVTASLCLQAYAPEEGDPDEKDLVQRFVNGEAVPLDIVPNNEVCRRALAKARAQVEGKEAP